MASDIRTAVSIGADGIVIGALTPGGDVDIPAMRTLLAVCPVPVTFHRAFDVCRDPEGALEEIIELGCKRILTSGQAQTALEGAELIRRLRLKADGRIILLPGGGITPETAAQVLALTGCSELHASASVRFEAADGGEHGFKVTSADKVAAIIAAMDAGSQ